MAKVPVKQPEATPVSPSEVTFTLAEPLDVLMHLPGGGSVLFTAGKATVTADVEAVLKKLGY